LLCGWEDHFRLVRVPKPAAAQAAFQVVGALTASGDAEPKSSSQAAWESRLSGDRLSLPLKDPSVAMPDQKILFQSPVRRIDESPDKNFLLIVTEDGRASLWNPRYGVETVVLAEKGCIAARFDPDSRRIQLLRRQPLKLLSAFNPAPFGFVERWELLETSLSPDNIQSRAITSPSSQ
jgi:hypothetical protein